MVDLRMILTRASEITKKRLAVITKNEIIVYPEGEYIDITFEDACKKAGKNYKGFNIYMSDIDGIKHFVCISAEKYYESETTDMVMLLLGSAVEKEASASAYLKKTVEGKYDAVELAKLEEVLKGCLPGYFMLVDGLGDLRDEVHEILINTIDVKTSAIYDNRIIAVADNENMERECNSFINNVLSELFIECDAVIGGRAVSARELHGIYENCIEALCLKNIYGIGDKVLNYGEMYVYRAAYNLDPRIKESINNKVFTEEFMEMVSGELGKTIEEFFKNNLNLTDTAAKLYIHRNTLLYRLEKIQKCTGFDLKKFEDSWLFKLAWIIHKEK